MVISYAEIFLIKLVRSLAENSTLSKLKELDKDEKKNFLLNFKVNFKIKKSFTFLILNKFRLKQEFPLKKLTN